MAAFRILPDDRLLPFLGIGADASRLDGYARLRDALSDEARR